MKLRTTLSILILALGQTASALPSLTSDQLKAYLKHSKKGVQDCPFADQAKRELEGGNPSFPSRTKKRSTIFNAQQQLINVSGDHAWKAPDFKAGDVRGPCPGLNALANHGYIPRNGVTDIATVTEATNNVFGMGLDLGIVLAVYGALVSGNPVSLDPGFSIGGPTPNSQNILNGGLGLLGTPTGLSGSHNKYEVDTSATRGDLYLYGNNFRIQRSQFVDYYNSLKLNTPASEQYVGLLPFRTRRFKDSEATNPYFYIGPGGVLFQVAGYSFPVRMMANHSDEFPDGYLSPQTFATFFGVQGTDNSSFVVNDGWERIPENWYRRAIGDDYGIAPFVADTLNHATKYPEFLSVGGNLGRPNTFTGVDISNLTGGVYNANRLLDPTQLTCFVLQTMMAFSPDLVGSSFSNVAAAVKPFLDTVQQTISGLLCPQLQSINAGLFDKYPGYTKSYDDYGGLPQGSGGGLLSGLLGTVGSLLGGH